MSTERNGRTYAVTTSSFKRFGSTFTLGPNYLNLELTPVTVPGQTIRRYTL